jgi:hypothetical protein
MSSGFHRAITTASARELTLSLVLSLVVVVGLLPLITSGCGPPT